MSKKPHPVDVIIARNLRRLRIHAGMSQSELGARIGVKYQQIQKYEKTINRIAASRLWDCAEALGVTIEVLCQAQREEELPLESVDDGT